MIIGMKPPGREQHKIGKLGNNMLRPSPNHGTVRLIYRYIDRKGVSSVHIGTMGVRRGGQGWMWMFVKLKFFSWQIYCLLFVLSRSSSIFVNYLYTIISLLFTESSLIFW